jgi:hypothetical protein
MDDRPPPPILRGIDLRYFLTLHLIDTDRTASIRDLTGAVADAGFALEGRPSKVISDALRWEVRKGRVQRLGRGRYRTGRMPRSTVWWIRRRVTTTLRAVVAPTLAD